MKVRNPDETSGGIQKIRRGRFDDQAPRSRGPSRKGTSGRRKAEPRDAEQQEEKMSPATPAPSRPTTVVRSLQELKSALRATQPDQQAAAEKAVNTEHCPVCGKDKFKTVTFERGDTKVTQALLVCGACTETYKGYRAEALKANVELVRKNPKAPEPPAPADKFHWVLDQMTPDKFHGRAQTAQANYRAQYDKVVVSVLKQRGYLNGEAHWEGSATTRPIMRFTQEAFSSGMAAGLREALEQELMPLRWAMKNAARCLEEAHVARVAQLRTELEAKLAAPAAAKDQPGE